jgi:acylphosphatase
MNKQVHAIYSGRVQGIGFRFTAIDVARDLSVSGWVKNLRDGSVEIVAEADESALDDFLARLENIFSRYIQDKEINWNSASGKFKDFSLEY